MCGKFGVPFCILCCPAFSPQKGGILWPVEVCKKKNCGITCHRFPYFFMFFYRDGKSVWACPPRDLRGDSRALGGEGLKVEPQEAHG